jgi:hypothetical protein
MGRSADPISEWSENFISLEKSTVALNSPDEWQKKLRTEKRKTKLQLRNNLKIKKARY